jgi:fatty acid desaturase
VVLARRSINDLELQRRLWDELASANLTRSMVFAYLAMLAVLCALAVFSMFSTALSAPWVVNGILITAFAVQAVSFALLERRGDARD